MKVKREHNQRLLEEEAPRQAAREFKPEKKAERKPEPPAAKSAKKAKESAASKKAKKEKSADAPKAPSAYILFSVHRRKQLNEENCGTFS